MVESKRNAVPLCHNNCSSTADFRKDLKGGATQSVRQHDITWHNYFQGSSLVSSDSPTPQTMRAEQSKHNRNWMCFPATTRCAALRYTDSTANASKTCKVTDSKTNCGWLVPSSSWRLYSFNLVWMITMSQMNRQQRLIHPTPIIHRAEVPYRPCLFVPAVSAGYRASNS